VSSFGADADLTGFASYPRSTNIDVIAAGSEIVAGAVTNSDVVVPVAQRER
jgi:hypothetical protein